MDKRINNNGYDYVDLDLPSGTLWATCNVGAKKPSECGLYFQWGDTIGYTAGQVGTGNGQKKFALDFSDYKWYSSEEKAFTKYTTTGETLDLEDDATHVNMGGDWHMPSPEQIQELIDNTAKKWTTQDGINGRLFTSKKDTSKSIFIPIAGYAWNGSVRNSGNYGYVWSSMLSSNYFSYGKNLVLVSGYDSLNYGSYRCNGFSVRGVIG